MFMLGILGMKISPPRMRERLASTNSTPWASVIQKRVMRGSVIGTTPRCRAARNSGTTLPRLPTTLP